ncbi:TrsD/TraD family conjugative transfer protein [Mammaliicoccus sciuri]|uniref:TrsD/TraD family conjugative transfer protein n=1 Tax=Mammaliicoccus sciuri TaxID=1296 RepID=UPI001F3D7965|nr:TrsD/TraD family conjugative transfer protein [Mammaliicoccus sciuri]MCE5086050.1 conjugal transfer protein [Mammaliicoccus sciuri]
MVSFKELFTKNLNEIDPYEEFTFKPKELDTGEQSFEENALIHGFYHNYLVTKTGYLIAIMEPTGVNLDLMNHEEQEEVFEDYNAFLMSSLTGAKSDVQQNIDTTFPVDFEKYVKSWKKQYLENLQNEEANEVLENLTASYVQEYSEYERQSLMSTKRHLVVIKTKIKKNNEESLIFAKQDLDEDTKNFRRDLEDALNQYDIEVRSLNHIELKKILKHFI